MDIRSTGQAGLYGQAPGLATNPSLPKVSGSEEGNDEAIREVARQFESVFLHQVFKSMRATVPKDGMMGSGFGGEVFTDLLDQEYANIATKNATSQLAETIAQQLGAKPQDQFQLSENMGVRRLHAINAYGEQNSTKGWDRPVDGEVSTRFGMRRLLNEQQSRMHSGIDITAPEGTSIKAARAGTVVFAADRGSLGKTVIIDHGNELRSLYANARDLHVQPGQTVEQGESIATVGTTGESTGAHLHFEVSQKGRSVDPAPLLGFKDE